MSSTSGRPSAVIEPKRRSKVAEFFLRLVREKPLGTTCGIVILLLIIVGIFADAVAPYPYREIHLEDRLTGSSFRYLLGTDYVFPRTANKVLKAYLKSVGVPDENIIEEYTPFHHQDYQTIVGNIKKFAAGGDACVLSTINGDSNVPFYREFANQGLTAEDCPIMAFSVAEDELRAMDVPPLVGHLAAWNYFQSIKSADNKQFVKNFKAYCKKNNLPGGASRVTDDPIEAAYFGVYVWKAAAEKAGSFDVDKVREAVYGLEFDAPGGAKKMHPNNQHTLKPVYIGEIKKNGQFKILHVSDGLVSPDSYSTYLHPDGNYPAPTGGPKSDS